LVPLHVAYTCTQADFAAAFLKTHPDTKLVTVGLGANDVFLLEKACLNDPACIAGGLPAVLANVTGNLTTILTDLRGTGFKGPIIVVNYYSTDYADANETGVIELLNEALAAAAATEGVPVADVFTAFQTVASAAGGHTCKVGLLKASPQNEFVCDVSSKPVGPALDRRGRETHLRQYATISCELASFGLKGFCQCERMSTGI
jgi:GDSL-like Lipase/Acylhydrolase family